MRIAHITTSSEGTAGQTALSLCETLQDAGHAALFCYATGGIPEGVPSYRIGSMVDRAVHKALARVLDCAGFCSRSATKKLTEQLTLYKPDLVHLYTLHGYYLHLPELMRYLSAAEIPVVWTMLDCWPFTGHCAHYARAGCQRFRSGCHHCPNLRRYPESLVLDRSAKNWKRKRDALLALENLTLVAPSLWLAGEMQTSYLAEYPVCAIPGGIDLNFFRPAGDGDVESVTARYGLRRHGDKPLILAVARTWTAAKGINDLMDLHEELKNEATLAVVGLTPKQMEYLPPGLIGIPVIYGKDTLRALYTAADLCISLRYEEAQDLTLIEALACGTQVLGYDTTSLPEIVTPETGTVVSAGAVHAVADACRALLETPKDPLACIARVEAFDRDAELQTYLALYADLSGDVR